MNNATRANTNDFIDGFDYGQLPTYGIEHIIGLARRDNVGGFSQEAERLFEKEKEQLTKTMIQRIAKDYMVKSKKMKQSETQSLNAKLFNDELKKDRLLLEQHRNKEKQ